LYFAANQQWDSAAVELRQVTRLSTDLADQSPAAAIPSAIALTRGQLGEAERKMGDYMAISERRALPTLYLKGAANLAQIQAVYHRNPAAAGKVLDQALARHPLAAMSPLDRPYPQLAAAYAMANQPARARALLKEYETLVPIGLRRGDASDPQDPYSGGDRAKGFLALAEGRGSDAAAAFRAWWDASGCANCAQSELGRAYDLSSQPDSAVAAYTRAADTPGGLGRIMTDQWNLAFSYRRLGELYEEKGNKEKALDYYGRLVQLWKDADPELQPQVKEVKDRMVKLTGEKPQ
jgi:tetratricopeptide (TPR) repeat protein